MDIIKADLKNLTDVARLFDLYRQFYDCSPDIQLATRFIQERIENRESDIFLAIREDLACGFVQLYPSFCSVQAVKIYILYDLYVESRFRRSGIGEKLMHEATKWATKNGAARLDLLTAKNNTAGQHLYEKHGYKKVLEDFDAYSLEIKAQ